MANVLAPLAVSVGTRSTEQLPARRFCCMSHCSASDTMRAFSTTVHIRRSSCGAIRRRTSTTLAGSPRCCSGEAILELFPVVVDVVGKAFPVPVPWAPFIRWLSTATADVAGDVSSPLVLSSPAILFLVPTWSRDYAMLRMAPSVAQHSDICAWRTKQITFLYAFIIEYFAAKF